MSLVIPSIARHFGVSLGYQLKISGAARRNHGENSVWSRPQKTSPGVGRETPSGVVVHAGNLAMRTGCKHRKNGGWPWKSCGAWNVERWPSCACECELLPTRQVFELETAVPKTSRQVVAANNHPFWHLGSRSSLNPALFWSNRLNMV